MIIAVDAAGGDYAPHEIVKGAVKAAQEYGVEIALVGRKNVLRVLAGRALDKSISIVEASQTIECDESPIKAVRNKPDSSIVVGVNLVKEGRAAAFVSAGSTGAVLCAGLLQLGKVKGIDRPAIGCFLDSISTVPALLIDAGANADCRPGHLLQFAQLGAIYSRNILGLGTPRVGLLSNGSEQNKGNHLVLETYQLLKKNNGFEFIGNIEPHDILKRTADVIVTDGFTGNIMLKTIEGMSDSFLTLIRQAGQIFSSVSQLRGRDLLQDVGLARKIDYREYGGAYLVGLGGDIIIAHGRSQARAVKSAIKLAKDTVERGIKQKIAEGDYE
ncbi:MAG: phosphate acyltransferase PlsX [Chloroflexi bacterium]|nr:phosphate acyltransferase PlsX [Chloroflexota bacterium]